MQDNIKQGDNAVLFEYTSAASPDCDKIKPDIFDFSMMELKVNQVNDIYQSPNIKVKLLKVINNSVCISSNASSHVFYVLNGTGTVHFNDQFIKWNQGDVFTIPFCQDIIFKAKYADILWANDEAIIDYLGVVPNRQRFESTYYSHEKLINFVRNVNLEENSSERNRNGVLLSNQQMVREKTNTLTHTMWSLLNVIGPNTIQKPHRHNSIAIDLCISAERNKVYTLMGKELNDDGTVKDPIKRYWQTNTMFITPPGWWHSHHNESDSEAWVFPVQDAGLYTYLNTLDIQFVK